MDQDAICAFDTLYTNQHIQMLKLALPLLPNGYQTFLAVYIRFLEFRYTLSLSGMQKKNTPPGSSSGESLSMDSIEKYLDSILPYMNEEDKKRTKKIKDTLQSMEQFKQLKPIIEMMMSQMDHEEKESETENEKVNGGSSDSMINLLSGMLTEEQQAMFEMFRGAM